MSRHRDYSKAFSAMAFVAGIFLVGVVGCGGSSSGSTGEISVDLTDATTDLYNAVYVTVDEVAVHLSTAGENEWSVVSTPLKTVNLIDLVNGVREELGVATLAAGHYTQMRLMIGDTADSAINILSQGHPYANYVIDSANEYHELRVPSGAQTGIKVVHGFDISANGTTELVLDFDASKSVVVAGTSGQYLLQPTIKVLSTIEASIISGTVTKDSDKGAIEGALISAQIYDASAADLKDQVTVETSTLSSETGIYSLFLAAGSYNIVASKSSYVPSVISLTTTPGSTIIDQDFSLVSASSGSVVISATIANGDAETYVTISFRQSISIGGTDEVIEVASINIVNGGSYTLRLPVGTYTAVSSTYDLTTQQVAVTINADASTTLNVTL